VAELYIETLRQAEKELADADAEAEELDRKRAKLRQTVAVLQTLTGVKVENDQSLTDAILLVVKAAPGFVTASEVMDRLFMMGFHAQTASVATILSRLAKTGKVNGAIGPNRSAGYGWKTETTKAEREAAWRAAAAKAGKKS
jgi:hypothetical protein